MADTREKLIELLSTAGWNLYQDGEYSKRQIADHLIANGVAIPVHCKDCKHWRDDIIRDDHEVKCCCIGMYMTKGDNFCSFGKRRDKE